MYLTVFLCGVWREKCERKKKKGNRVSLKPLVTCTRKEEGRKEVKKLNTGGRRRPPVLRGDDLFPVKSKIQKKENSVPQ